MRRPVIGLLALLLVVSGSPFFLFACAGMEGGQKEMAGTLIGSIAGGVIGSKFGKGSGNTAATIAGAIVGGYFGGRIGAYLDEVDRRMQEQATLAALQSVQSRSHEAWNNTETGVRGEVIAGPTVYEPRRLVATKTPNMILLNADYLVLKNANVCAEPTTDASVVASLRADETFRAVGKVEETNWIMAARKGRTIGYVHGSLVKPIAAVTPKPIEVQDEVVVAVKCRPIIRSATLANGETLEEKIRYCQEPDGHWVMQA